MAPIHHSQTVRAWLPIRTTTFHHHETNTDLVDECIKSFIDSLPTILPALVPEISEVEVTRTPPPPTVMNWLCRNSSLVNTNLFEVHSISATVSYVDTWNKVEPGDDTSFLRANAAYYIEKAISLALPIAELAYPGTIMTTEGAVTDEGEGILAQLENHSFLSCAWPYDKNLTAWPAINYLNLESTVSWAKSIGFTSSSFALTRIQRTLASFTHVVGLGNRNEGETLFRSMQGLEAFYCDGIGDLRRQLSHKSEIWLGPIQGDQNMIGKLYELRSKYIHGATKMQYWHEVSDPWEEDRKTMERFSEAVDLATRLLLASLQKCAVQGATDVNWAYKCNVTTSELPADKKS